MARVEALRRAVDAAREEGDSESCLRRHLALLRAVAAESGSGSSAACDEKVKAADLCSNIALGLVYDAEGAGGQDRRGLRRAKDLVDCAQHLTRRGTLGGADNERRTGVARSRAQAMSTQACLLKKTGRCRAALKCAQRARHLYQGMLPAGSKLSALGESTGPDSGFADTRGVGEAAVSAYLTECALCLSCGKASAGAALATSALRLCQSMRQEHGGGDDGAGAELAPLEAISNYNLGACEEALRNEHRALACYRRAFELAYHSVGEDHPLSQRFRRCFADAYVKAHRRRVYRRHGPSRATSALGASALGGRSALSGVHESAILSDPLLDEKLCQRYAVLSPVGRRPQSAASGRAARPRSAPPGGQRRPESASPASGE